MLSHMTPSQRADSNPKLSRRRVYKHLIYLSLSVPFSWTEEDRFGLGQTSLFFVSARMTPQCCILHYSYLALVCCGAWRIQTRLFQLFNHLLQPCYFIIINHHLCVLNQIKTVLSPPGTPQSSTLTCRKWQGLRPGLRSVGVMGFSRLSEDFL